MEAKIMELTNLLNSKYQEFFIISAKRSDIHQQFKTPITLDATRNYELGLKYFSVANSIKNVSDGNNKFHYSRDGGTTWFDKTLPTGSYEIKALNDYINSDNIKFEPYVTTNRVKLVLKNNHQVDFSKDNTIRNLLGFESKIYATTTIAENRANLENDISSINIHCDLIQGGYLNGEMKNIIYSIPSFTVPLGYRIIEQPISPIYLPVNKQSIREIRLRIVDDEGRLIDFGDEEIYIQIHLKQV